MAHPGAINSLRYLDRSRLKPEHSMYNSLYQEIISSFGVDTVYFRNSTTFFPYASATNINYTYGEKSQQSYTVSAPMVVFMEQKADSILMGKFGFVNEGDASCYISKQEFYENMRDLIGIPVTSNFNVFVSGYAPSGSTQIPVSGIIMDNYISGFTSSVFTLSAVPATWATINVFWANAMFTWSGAYYGSFPSTMLVNYSAPYGRTPHAVNPYTYRSKTYDNQIVNGTLSGTLNGTTGPSGIFLSGYVSGPLSYHVASLSATASNYWGIYEKHDDDRYAFAPKVGDFFRLGFQDFNQIEYEITEVTDKDMTSNGINPLLQNYVWKCTVVRRIPSKENVIGSKQQEEMTPDFTEQNDVHDLISDKIFNYDTTDVDIKDKKNASNTYGGY